MKNPTPSSGGVFGGGDGTPVHGILSDILPEIGVLAEGSADTDITTNIATDIATGAATDIAVDVGADIGLLSDDDLEASIVAFKQRIDALQAGLLLRIGEYHKRELAPLRHLLSTVGWIRQALRLTSGAASSMVRTARTLTTMPAVAEAASMGAITPDGVRLLTQAKRRHPLEFDHHEAVFADIAQYLSTKDLRVAIEYWEQQVDYPSAVAKVKALRQRRRFSISQTWEGMWHLSGELDPETGSLVDTAIRSIVDRENLVASRNGSDDGRYPWQRRADALGDVASFWLNNSDQVGTSGGTKPHIVVTTSLETLVGLKEELPTIDGLVFDPGEMQRITCDSEIIRMILDADSQPLDVGRRYKTVTPAIRRALDQRDGGCQWEGCDAPPSWCDAHHLTHWTNGGETSLTNMTLLCRTHHRATHQNRQPDKLQIPP